MKRTILLMIALMFVGMSAQAASIDKLMNKVIKAYGGEKALNNITAVDMEISINAGGMSQEVKMKTKDPDLFYMDVNVMGQNMKFSFDGNKYWMNQGGKVMEAPAQQAPQLKGQADQLKDLVKIGLADYKTDGNTYTKKGRETVDGVECVLVEVTKKGEEGVSTIYINKKTNLIHQMVTTAKQQGQEVKITVKAQDYKKVNGIMIAHTLKIDQMGQAVEFKIKKLSINPKIDNKVFTLK
jgi:zinc protease